MVRLALIVVALSGCDLVIGLTHVKAGDGVGVDADGMMTDAPLVCATDGTHDEDGDGYPDTCDKCPTVTSAQGDADGDGVGDECDPSARPDTIIAFYPMSAPTSGVTLSDQTDQGLDSVTTDNTSVTTIHDFSEPERLVVAVAHLDKIGELGSLSLSLGPPDTGFSCSITECAPATTPATTCVRAFSSSVAGPNVPTSIATKAVTALIIDRVSSGNLRCGVNDLAAGHTSSAAGTGVPGPIMVYTSIGPVETKSLIVYDKL